MPALDDRGPRLRRPGPAACRRSTRCCWSSATAPRSSSASEAEREFVSNAAHELRNPLAGISSAIEVLRGGAKDDPEARDRFLDRLGEDAERMTRLTQSLLMLARVEAAGEREEAEVVDVTLAAEEAAEAVEPPEGVELERRDRARPGRRGRPGAAAPGADRPAHERLQEHARAGQRLPFAAPEAEGGAVTIEVEDTGKGIPAEEQDRVFERFYRGSGALEGEGFGLGLSIAKRMVRRDGRRDRPATPSPAAARTFWVRLREPKPTPTPVA